MKSTVEPRLFTWVLERDKAIIVKAHPAAKKNRKKYDDVMLRFTSEQELPCLLAIVALAVVRNHAHQDQQLPDLSYSVLESDIWKWCVDLFMSVDNPAPFSSSLH